MKGADRRAILEILVERLAWGPVPSLTPCRRDQNRRKSSRITGRIACERLRRDKHLLSWLHRHCGWAIRCQSRRGAERSWIQNMARCCDERAGPRASPRWRPSASVSVRTHHQRFGALGEPHASQGHCGASGPRRWGLGNSVSSSRPRHGRQQHQSTPQPGLLAGRPRP